MAVDNWSAMPLRLAVALPVAVIALAVLGAEQLPADARLWPIWLVAMAGAWLITFFTNVAVGSLAFYLGSSVKVMEVWLALYFVLSGYTIPVEVFPEGARALVDVLPFRFQIGYPVELLTGAKDVGWALGMLGQQWAWVLVTFALAVFAWRRGVRRFEAYGG
jgi:ABC-2 type transport system permease protein